jgi:hypothetical protein
MEANMPTRWQIDHEFTIAAGQTQPWLWNFFTDVHGVGQGPNKGPVIFRASPKGRAGQNPTARNVLVTYDFATCRGGPGDQNAPEVFYAFKIRNESTVAVPFVLEIILFNDLTINHG